MRAWLELSVPEFFALSAEDVAARLAYSQAGRHATLELTQRNAWVAMAQGLREALAMPEAEAWTLLLEYDLLRLEKRIDAILLTDRATLVLEWKDRAARFLPGDLRQVEDYALDLHDFHGGCRAHPVVPLLVATDGPATPFEPPLIWQGVPPPMKVNRRQLGERLREVMAAIGTPARPMIAAEWVAAPYRPVPNVLEAASMLFDRHRSAAMVEARADASNLTRTTDAILRAIADARASGERVVIFVTGIPGAGKTLCGLNIVFGALRDSGAAFLTGNAPLVAVLREDLRRRSGERKDRARTVLQNVHRFLEHHVLRPAEIPEARVIVFDEAQRAWDQDQASRDTQRRVSRLSLSEPAHTLDIMGRHGGWCAIVALIGQGQEINTGEAGLEEWASVIAQRPEWRAVAAPGRLLAQPWLTEDPALDLTVPMRSVRHPQGAPWVDAVLRAMPGRRGGSRRSMAAFPSS
ncbi:DNA/RNA helicase domain-containing protein [Roseococcus sp. YIM B11640]|uniref:DNA/RNA helicase domain-containing protein n=1 Tax=Roseococcus sp. YIM B11640 TaxID=3133973 RepID=UPI003C7D51AB